MKSVVLSIASVIVGLATGYLLWRPCPRLPQYAGPPIAGQFAIDDLDEITLDCSRLSHDVRLVRMVRDRLSSNVKVTGQIIAVQPDFTVTKTSSIISEEEFADIEEQLLRGDLFSRSLQGSDLSTYESNWAFHCKKGDFGITHRRRNAPDTDAAFTALALKVLRMGGVEIPNSEVD